MSASTPNHHITYPTATDKIIDTPAHLKTLAETVEHALDNMRPDTGPVSAKTLTALQAITGVPGQIGYVTNDASDKNGLYFYQNKVTKWTRGAHTPGITYDRPHDDWDIEIYSWVIMGAPYIYARAKAKKEIKGFYQATIAALSNDMYKPPSWIHLTMTSNDAANQYGIQISTNGDVIIESFASPTVKAGTIVFGTITWPCTSAGYTKRTY
ncbi:hypothetical protein [Bifidobacterium choerinum]|uniref:Uncharacterized protein n=1 Tax=Bifidobacterium choerinum TaxID=35760 RepID=A0A2D3D3T8_9BIFI|nr:hypothetical protein [Bifidobacterium choerinum]ATU19819.1 hypothetical protein BcFMB_01440 [Bifidobacterium choerinum]